MHREFIRYSRQNGPLFLSTRFVLIADRKPGWIGKVRISSQANTLPALCSVAEFFSYLVPAGKAQFPGLRLPKISQMDRASAVQIFKDSYDPYVKITFPHDDLAPVSTSFVGQ